MGVPHYLWVLLWAVVGYIGGAGAWLAARCFAGGDEGQSLQQDLPRRLPWLLDTQGAISLPAALIQGAMALGGAYLGWRGLAWDQIAAVWLVTGLLLTISLVDFRARRIPNILVLALFLLAVAQMLWLGQPTPAAAVLGMLEGGVVFLVLALIRRGAMGAGDVKLAAALGALLGAPLICEGLFLGVLMAGLAALFLLVTRRAGRKDYMAYGPYLALGAWLVWLRSMGLWL